MNVKVIKIGKPAFPEYESMTAVYEQRLKKFIKFERQIVKAEPGLQKNRLLICLDEHGEQWSSKVLAKSLGTWLADARIKEICFLIGGPYGLSPECKKASDFCWSLSAGTLTSDMAWLLVCEQIYRAFTILNGSKYHH